MRRLTLLLFLASITFSCSATKPVTVSQLEALLAHSKAKPDSSVAKELADCELTERLSAARLAAASTHAPGAKSRQALMAIADLSAFLSLPTDEIPDLAIPDRPAQRRMLALTVDYVTQTIHKLPNLLTTRVTTSFQDAPWRFEKASQESVSHQPFHFVGTYTAGVVYRRGEEVVSQAAAAGGTASQGLTTSGEFGPILGTAMLDAAQGKLGWSHWEGDAAAPVAVYHYAVPAEKSHYEVKYCCIVRDAGDRIYFQKFAGYQGEIAVDPLHGTILRLTLRADLKPTDPLTRADVLVEYGSVDIGGKPYICPVKSIALSVGLDLQPSSRQGAENALRPLRTSLNDVSFEQYHVFRADSRVLPAQEEK